jgi:hypothetical protein
VDKERSYSPLALARAMEMEIAVIEEKNYSDSAQHHL